MTSKYAYIEKGRENTAIRMQKLMESQKDTEELLCLNLNRKIKLAECEEFANYTFQDTSAPSRKSKNNSFKFINILEIALDYLILFGGAALVVFLGIKLWVPFLPTIMQIPAIVFLFIVGIVLSFRA